VTLAPTFCLSLRLFLAPGQHSTPREGKEGAGVVAALLPSCRQIEQLFRRRDPVASDGGLQLAITTFSCSVGGESADPIRRPVADIVTVLQPFTGSLMTHRWREIVWPPSAGQGRFGLGLSCRLQVCVRPVRAAMPLALMDCPPPEAPIWISRLMRIPSHRVCLGSRSD
jgi:hypothetical protein